MRWAGWAIFALGLWLIAAPFLLSHTEAAAPLLEDMLLGILIASLTLARVVGTEPPAPAAMSWAVAAAGLWVLIAPSVLGYAGTAAAYNDRLVGLAVLLLGTWNAASRPQGRMPHMAPRH